MLRKNWLFLVVGVGCGGVLAYLAAALVSVAGGNTPLSSVQRPGSRSLAAQPVGVPTTTRKPREASPDPLSSPVASPMSQLIPIAETEAEKAPAVEFKEFKHVMLRKAAYMNLPEDTSQLWKDFRWKQDGEIPAGELIRYEQSLPTRERLCLIQRADGEHMLLSDPGDFRVCWKVEVSAEARQLADTRNAFAWDLYHQFRGEPGNLFFSPSSIAEALCIALAGARRVTAAEISTALKLGKGPADVHAAAADLRKLLHQADRQRGFEVLTANRGWAHQGFTIEQPFAATLREHYGAELGRVDFEDEREAARAEMNRWISEQTKGHLPEVISAGDINKETRLVLASAIYFFGEWDVPFEKKLTKQEPFYLGNEKQASVAMMNRSAELPYFHGDGFQAVSIPYGKGQLAMVALVPDEVGGLPALEASLSRKAVDEWLAQLKPESVELALPRLEMRSRLDLKETLKSLGVQQAFDLVNADFSGMHIPNPNIDGDNLFLGGAIHEATVKVDEEGTVATAATVLMMMAGGVPPPPPKVRANRPFLFLIRDELTGSILFIGRATDPR